MDKVISLCKRRGFIFPGSEIYGGLANSWDYGPLGAELKKNIKDEWWSRFVRQRPDMVGIDAALIMNPKVWEASGHLATFNDPLVECKSCNGRFREDVLVADYIVSSKDLVPADKKYKELIVCPTCGKKGTMSAPRQFNLMLETYIGPVSPMADVAKAFGEKINTDKPWTPESLAKAKNLMGGLDKGRVYFRPEIAQAMFVNFKNVLETSRKRLPFGIASQGSAFRNEITPGNFIFRTREFDLMEFEYFIDPKDWEKTFEYWLGEMKRWLSDLGVKSEHLHFVEVSKEDRAHYSQRTVDIEYDYPFGQKELYGLAYRGDFDLSSHAKASKEDLAYTDPEDQKNKFIPHVIEPSFGLNRSLLVALLEAYHEEEAPTAKKAASAKASATEEETETRVVMKFPKWLAPVKVAILPLSKKDELAVIAKPLYAHLAKQFVCEYDETQSIGKRYRRQDEIGTPFCVTVDFDSINDNAVTVRDRDTMKQERVLIAELDRYLAAKLTA